MGRFSEELRSSVSRSFSRGSVFIGRSQQRVADWSKFKLKLIFGLGSFQMKTPPLEILLETLDLSSSQHLLTDEETSWCWNYLGYNFLGEFSWGFKLLFIELYLHIWIYIYISESCLKQGAWNWRYKYIIFEHLFPLALLAQEPIQPIWALCLMSISYLSPYKSVVLTHHSQLCIENSRCIQAKHRSITIPQCIVGWYKNIFSYFHVNAPISRPGSYD